MAMLGLELLVLVLLSQLISVRTESYYSEECRCLRNIENPSEWRVDEAVDWCSRDASLRGYHQNVITYSLFGDAIDRDNWELTRYYSLLNAIPRQVAHWYPDWRIRIYHNFADGSLNRQIACDVYCHHDNVDLCNIDAIVRQMAALKTNRTTLPFTAEEMANLEPVNWRFLGMVDPRVDCLMMRDVDSEINQRERAAVAEWLQSERTFHVLRDHQGHGQVILTGMFGAKLHQHRDEIDALTRILVTTGGDETFGYGFDQHLLAQIYWPTVKDDAVIHDSYYCERDWNSLPAMPYPTQRLNLEFVTDRNGSHWGRPEPCPLACRPADHQEWQYC